MIDLGTRGTFTDVPACRTLAKHTNQRSETWHPEAEWIGYPVLMKPAAGVNVKGMRVVFESDELPGRHHRDYRPKITIGQAVGRIK